MHSFFQAAKRSIVLLTALFACVVAVLLAPISYWWLLLLAISLPLLILSLRDFFQRDRTLSRNYPGAARLRWLAYDLRPFLRQYIVEGDLEGMPFNFDARNLVHARARGDEDMHPFGSERDMDEEGYYWVSHSIAPAARVDTGPRVVVGNEQTAQPYDASLFNISAMSFGAISPNAIEALNLGAKLGDFYHDTGEGGISRYHLNQGGDLVWEIGSGYFGCRNDAGHFDPEQFRDQSQQDAVRMTEIKLSRGPNPDTAACSPPEKLRRRLLRSGR